MTKPFKQSFQVSHVPDPTWRTAGQMVSLASLGGLAGERLQMLVAAALAWTAAEQDLSVAQLVGPMAIVHGDRPDLTLRAQELKERDARRSFEEAARELQAWAASLKEQQP